MWQTSLAKRASAKAPAPRTAGKAQLHRSNRFPLQARAKPEFFRRKTEKTFQGAAQEVHTRAIDQPQLFILIKSKDREIDFFHYGLEEGRSFQRAEALQPQR